MSTNSSFRNALLTKKSNVFVLLNTLYTSGLGSVSPINPLLTSKTMHTLYAISFLVYLVNSTIDWFHVYFILTGHVVSFPLEPWFSVSLVALTVIGSTLNGLLLALCMENAFIQRINLAPYKNGFAVIIEAFVEWLQSFNNFRVAFLVTLFRDLPWTIINFLLISSCRWPELSWNRSLIFSSISILTSLIWRFVMLYYSYRRLLSEKHRTRKGSRPVKQLQGIKYYFKNAINMADGGRLDEKDESWPIRFAISKVYGLNYQKMTTKIFMINENKTFGDQIYEIFSIVIFRTIGAIKYLFKKLSCAIIAAGIYFGWVLICCGPCCSFYFCRIDSLAHRHKFAKSFVRICTLIYHYGIFLFSTILIIILIVLNVIFLTSTNVGKLNSIPPQLENLCLKVDNVHRNIQPFFSQIFDPIPTENGSTIICKTVWDQSAVDQESIMTKPWQTRLKLDPDHMLIVSLLLHGNRSNFQEPFYSLYYDFGVLRIQNNKLKCPKNNIPKWIFEETLRLPFFPYFFACQPVFSTFRYNGISC